MQKHQLYINLFAITSALALGACADEENGVVTPEVEVGEKTPIELSIGGIDTQGLSTRAVITDGTGKTLVALPHGNSIYMLMKADDLSTSPQTTKCTRTVGFAQSIAGNTTSNLSFTASNEGDKFIRYWDDVFARKSAISIAAVCTPGYGPTAAGGTIPDTKAWRIGGDGSFDSNVWTPITSSTTPTLYWPIAYPEAVTDQSKVSGVPDFITYQDLCFSNNIGDNTSQSEGDTRLKFDEGTKKFRSGNLIFYHALSKLTFNIKQGQGFRNSEFMFKDNTNIKLSNFNNGGTFNISTGVFEGELTKTDISKIFQRTLTSEETASGIKFGLSALVIPGTDLSASGASTTNAVTFTLAGNEYKLTQAQLYNLFSAEQQTTYFVGGKLKAGVHYVFNLTVGKSKIEKITAQLLDWETVSADLNPSNARIKLQLEERGVAQTSDVAFYSMTDNNSGDINDDYASYKWFTGYSYMGATYSPDHWSTDEYWHSSNEFYHFRALMPASTAVTTEATDGDYVTLTSKSAYTDVCWGAPMKDDGENETAGTFKWTYDPASGFDNSDHSQIYKAIGATDNPIKLILFHMMSDLTFNIKTTTGADQVVLKDGENKASVKIVGLSTVGKVLLGNGRVIPNAKDPDDILSIPVDWNSNNSSGTHVYKYGAVPQDLDGVKLYITTLDNNQYIVDLASIVASAANLSSNSIANPYHELVEDGLSVVKYVINSWYPGFKYTYNLTLKKKGITDITATVVNWETVDTDDEEVTIQ